MSKLNSMPRVSRQVGRMHTQPRFDLLPPALEATVEVLESRTLFSISASAQLTLVSTTGTPQVPIYNYDIALKNTGTTNIGTFWFAWIPGEDFLPSQPLSESSPAGWNPLLTGSHNSADGTAIQWVAGSSASAVPAGQTLDGFTFSSHDSPAAIASPSPSHPSEAVGVSFVYVGGPELDPGFEFTVASPAPSTPLDSVTTLATSNPSAATGTSVTFTATVSPATPGGAAQPDPSRFSTARIPLAAEP